MEPLVDAEAPDSGNSSSSMEHIEHPYALVLPHVEPQEILIAQDEDLQQCIEQISTTTTESSEVIARDIEKCINEFTQTIEENLESFIDISAFPLYEKVKGRRLPAPKEKPIFKCGECDKVFNLKHHLQTHMKVHIPDKAYICQTCGKEFSLKHHLIQHIRVHTGCMHSIKKAYICRTCGKEFSLKHHLIQHIRVHTGEKPYKCEVCQKCFLSSSNLKRHMDTHPLTVVKIEDQLYMKEKEPEHECQVCSRMFKRREHLIRHVQIHTGDYQFKCNMCDKQFIRKYHLERHLKTHNRTKMTCPKCKKKYVKKHCYDAHVEICDYSDSDKEFELEETDEDFSDINLDESESEENMDDDKDEILSICDVKVENVAGEEASKIECDNLDNSMQSHEMGDTVKLENCDGQEKDKPLDKDIRIKQQTVIKLDNKKEMKLLDVKEIDNIIKNGCISDTTSIKKENGVSLKDFKQDGNLHEFVMNNKKYCVVKLNRIK